MKKIVLAAALAACLGTPAMAQKALRDTIPGGPFGPDTKKAQVVRMTAEGAALGCGVGAAVGSIHGAWLPGCGVGAAVLGGIGALMGHILPTR